MNIFEVLNNSWLVDILFAFTRSQLLKFEVNINIFKAGWFRRFCVSNSKLRHARGTWCWVLELLENKKRKKVSFKLQNLNDVLFWWWAEMPKESDRKVDWRNQPYSVRNGWGRMCTHIFGFYQCTTHMKCLDNNVSFYIPTKRKMLV